MVLWNIMFINLKGNTMSESNPHLAAAIEENLRYITEYLRQEIQDEFTQLNKFQKERYVRDLIVLFEEDQIDFILNRK